MRDLTLLTASAVIALSLAACSKPAAEDSSTAPPIDAKAPATAPQPANATVVTPTAPPPTTASTEGRYSLAYETCMKNGDAAQGVTMAMADCIHAEIEGQDAELNRTYQQVMSGLEESQRGKLRQAQRSWIKFRDAKCESESQSGGTMDILNGGSCVLDATIARTQELEAMTSEQ